jgi:hypothetical protein
LAFTPILPMMQEDAGVSIAMGGWLGFSVARMIASAVLVLGAYELS